MDSFIAQEASMPTMFYMHGNTLKHDGAMKQCWSICKKLRCCPGKKRLVFWSWPAQRVYKTERLRVREMIQKNLRIKYVYAEYQGYYLAKLVQRMSLSQRVMLAGHPDLFAPPELHLLLHDDMTAWSAALRPQMMHLGLVQALVGAGLDENAAVTQVDEWSRCSCFFAASV